MDQNKKIGGFITDLRQARNMTQKELAEALGTSQSAVARMEKGEQSLTTDMLRKVSKALERDIVSFTRGTVNLKIKGGRPLKGTIVTNTAKNSAVALLCASFLNEGKTTLRNVPKIEEVYRIIEVLSSIGMNIEWKGRDLILKPKKIDLKKINYESAIKTRSIILLLGSLSHKLENFSLPQPGGCKLGARTVRPHLYALENFGIKIKAVHGAYNVEAKKLKSADFVLYEAGDTVAENAIMAAARIPGKTTIRFAPSNYMVQDTCHFLEKLGVKIEGVGTSTLVIYGKDKINEDVEYFLSEDPIESMLFISIAATTGSELKIMRSPIDFLSLELLKLKKMGFKYKILKEYKSQNGYTRLVDIQTFPSKLVALEEKIHPLPYPGINIDNLPFFVPIATQAKGVTLIHDWVYENRAIYYTELNKLGANVVLADPHRLYINGPTEFRPAEIICPPALRPAALILIAMLAADGESILRNIYSIARGYEDLAERLSAVGAKIEAISGLS